MARLFLAIRSVTSLVALMLLGLTYVPSLKRYAKALFLAPIFACALCVQVMIVYTGGYASPYYGGLCLCMLAFAVVVTPNTLETVFGCAIVLAVWVTSALLNSSQIHLGPFLNNLFFLVGTAAISVGTSIWRFRVMQERGHDEDKRDQVLFPNRIGRYEVVRRLGIGGMAETFVGVAKGPGAFEQRVCLKCVLPTYLEDQRFSLLFMEEARITASLQHANIVKVIDFGERLRPRMLYLVLELVEGTDLRVLLRHQGHGGLPHAMVTLIAGDIAAALAYAHGHPHAEAERTREGVVHRDISPSNVLLSRSGEIKVTDFGIAKELCAEESTLTTGFKGKLVYMSPEQLRGKRLDARSDLFSLGVMLYECLCGERPFDGEGNLQTVQRILTSERPSLATRCPTDTPEALIHAIESLLEADPNKRCSNAAAFADALPALAQPSTTRRALAEKVRQVESKLADIYAEPTQPFAPGSLPSPASSTSNPPAPQAD